MNPNVQIITAKQLKTLQAAQPDVCIIDVREMDEWEAAHIAGATHIPLGHIAEEIARVVENKSQPIYLHCHAGKRSFRAGEVLCGLGYSQVYSLEGGLSAWEQEGFPVE